MTLKKCLFGLFIVAITACRPVPKKNTFNDRPFSDNVINGLQGRSLWTLSTDYTTEGSVGRLDSQTSQWKQGLFSTTPDSGLVRSDRPDELFVLSRMQGCGQSADSVLVLTGSEAKLKSRHYFPCFSESDGTQVAMNPSFALRDPNGSIWVSFLNSNHIYQFSDDFSRELGSTDLTLLKDSADAYAEPATMMIHGDSLIVGLQRLQRKYQGGFAWVPSETSALAFINRSNGELTNHTFPSLSNLFLIYQKDSDLVAIGSGDLSQTTTKLGTKASLSSTTFETKSQRDLGLVLSADWDPIREKLFSIRWLPSENKSCVREEEETLTCETDPALKGYLFTQLKIIGDIMFVTFKNLQQTQLWAYDLNKRTWERADVRIPIVSLTDGP